MCAAGGLSASRGDTDRLGEFVYEVPRIHRTRARIAELSAGRRIVWHVIENWFASRPDLGELAGSDIVFEIEPTDEGARLTFTHIGLTPALECFDSCAMAWSHHALESLRALITTGSGAPITPADETALEGA